MTPKRLSSLACSARPAKPKSPAGARSRLFAVLLLVLTAVAAPAAVAVSAPREDWVLIKVRAGAAGAREVYLETSTTGTSSGVEPTLIGLAYADGGRGDSVVTSLGGGSTAVETSLGAGAVHLESGVTNDPRRISNWAGGGFRDLVPGETVAMLVYMTGVRLDGWTVRPTKVTGGTATTTVLRGSGSRALVANSSATEGTAVSAGAAAVGTTSSSMTAPRGMVGGLLSLSCEVCTGTWSAPGTGDRMWTLVSPNAKFFGMGSRIGWSSFAGPAGAWKFTWTGATSPVRVNGETTPVYGAVAPIGDDWTMFTPQPT